MRAPEVPVKVTVDGPGAAFEAAVKVRFCAVPGVSVGAEGFEVTPVGNPDNNRFTFPLKPFMAVAVTEADWPAPPPVKVRLVGETASEKSGAGAVAEIVRARVAV